MQAADHTCPPHHRGNIFLVGLMGAGKTSVGKVLARLLGKAFIDCDHEIERTTGVRIREIFEIEGEAGFRAREHKMIAELVTRENILLATGGGAVLSRENRDLLHRNGTVIYLRAPVKALLRRTQRDRARPLLQVADPAAKLTALYLQRDPLYCEVAHLIFDTSNQSVRALAGQIEAKLKSIPVNAN
ncbi:MAG: shikimate kinase [Betaproteobacteria bacterium]|nr:shikimate kinase [Betaproteobacteria bacterium]